VAEVKYLRMGAGRLKKSDESRFDLIAGRFPVFSSRILLESGETNDIINP